MSYLQLDHQFFKHPKHAALSDLAVLMHVTAIHYSSDTQTDGYLPKRPASLWAMHLVESGRDISAIVSELIEAGLWADCGDRWHIVNYLEWNHSREQIAEKARRKAENQRAYRERKTTESQETDDSVTPQDEYENKYKGSAVTDRPVAGELPVTPQVEEKPPAPIADIRQRLRGGAA